MFTRHRSIQKAEGYIVVVVLLLAAVLLMLGLSFAARTTEQVFLSSQEADTTRVFNAAESGIEQALYQLDTGQNVTNTLNLNDVSVGIGTSTVSNVPLTVEQGETLTLKPAAGGTVSTLTWTPTAANCPGLLVTLYRTSGGITTAYHQTFSSALTAGSKCRTTLAQEAGMSGSNNTITLATSHFGLTGAFSAATDTIRVTPLYGDITFNGLQTTAITATAEDTIDAAGSTEVRKVQVIRTEPGPPSVFDYAVFSGGNLQKN